MRLHILGGAGSGKTHVARQTNERFAIPHYDLDDLFWDKSANEYGIKAPDNERDRALQAIVSQNDWIIEGVYIDWLDPSFRSADKIFVLMTPLRVQEERIWRRHEERRRGSVASKKETHASVVKLIEWNRKYNAQWLPYFINNSEYTGKIMTVGSNTELFEHMKLLGDV